MEMTGVISLMALFTQSLPPSPPASVRFYLSAHSLASPQMTHTLIFINRAAALIAFKVASFGVNIQSRSV